MTRWLSWPDRERLDAGSGRNGCLAPASQRRGPHLDLAVAQPATPRRRHRIPQPGWFSVHSDTDLSRIALGVAAPARDRAPHRSGQAGCDPYRDRRADRPRGGRLLPKARPALHHQLHDALPENISAPPPIPQTLLYPALRRFHAARTRAVGATPSLIAELRQRGFSNRGMWTRGVDTDLFRPDRAIELGFTRPIFVSVGRLAVEKNLEAFLSLDLPGTKVVIGTGPEEAALKRRFPDAKFL